MPMIALIGLGAGVATALLLASTTTGGLGLRLLVYLLAPLPLILAGLGAGYRAAIVGGLMVGVLENLGGVFVSSSFKRVTSFIILIAVLMIRPAGLFGKPPRKMV